ncbi:MAG: DUF488 family protein [Microbacteriaceae bacterium]
MSSPSRIFTVGHSTRSFDDVLGMLQHNGVTTLVDVRSYPSSRAYPQWNQDAITEALPPTIDYRWMRDLGGRRHTPAGVDSPNTGWRVKAFRDYADYMATPPFRSALAELLQLSTHAVPAIMCSEAVPWRCHRRLITDALIVAGCQVMNIMSATSTQVAQLTDFARLDSATLTYAEPYSDPGSDPHSGRDE